MRTITQIPSVKQDEIVAMYHNFYLDVIYKDIGIMVNGVNDGLDIADTSQDEVFASYGIKRLITTANSTNIVISGINDKLDIKVEVITADGKIKEDIITLTKNKELPTEILKLVKEDNFKFKWKFI